MANFKNTIDVLGDDAVIDSIINRTIQEYNDDTVTKAGQYAFCKCTKLDAVELPNATQISDYAFDGCTALKSVKLPKAGDVGGSAFRNCTSLESVTFPAAIYLYGSAFNGCAALKSADFHVARSIYGYVFQNCTKLATLILRSESVVCTLAQAALEKTMIASGTGYVYVPSALIDSYKVASVWSTYANQFRKLEEWTVDGTVTGAFATNRHMVRFFNSDGTLLGYKIVTTGSNATWDGATPVNPDGSAPFTGFNPEPVNVTEDMDCYAQYSLWGAVFASIDAGTYATDYAIGDTVPLDLGSEGIINMQIVAFDMDDLADGSGKAPITWVAKELLASWRHMNPELVTNADGTYQDGTGCTGGWEKSLMRTYLKDTIKPMIPSDVRNRIKEVSKRSPHYDTLGTYTANITTDDVWIPSHRSWESISDSDYPFFKTQENLIKRYAGSGNLGTWWTRSGMQQSNFWQVNEYGGTGLTPSQYAAGVALGFCT